ncbi:methyltransferase type 11 [Ktedonobacteria bacterium brp13]|nr:methyltransferase type 11 [Ktedonobacteria bacterium brp13]
MHLFNHHHRKPDGHAVRRTQGTVVSSPAWLYDLMVRWFVYHGKEQKLRHLTADLAQLQPGEMVLDVGCGTGTIALVAKQRVGAAGRVCGIDPSPQLLAGAQRKAKHARLPIDFQLGGIEHLPFPNQSFDVVLSTFVMHHLPDDLKRQGLAEIARVLKPEGRLLVVDFKHPEGYQDRHGQFSGELDIQDLPALMKEAGFSQTESGETPLRVRMSPTGHLHSGFVLARKSQSPCEKEKESRE